MSAIEEAEAMLRMAHMDFRALTGMENEEPLIRPLLIAEVQALLEHVQQSIPSRKPL